MYLHTIRILLGGLSFIHSLNVAEFLLFQAYVRCWENKEQRCTEENLARRMNADRAVTNRDLIQSAERLGRRTSY